MGFGIKVDVPKVEVPKVDVGASVNAAAKAATDKVGSVKDSAISAADSAQRAVADAVGSAKDAVKGAVTAAGDAVNSATASLSAVAGAIAEVAVSFTGATSDIVLAPHLTLDANASYGKTQFKKGPVWIRMEQTPDEATVSKETLRLVSESGAFDEKKKVADFTDDNGRTVVVLFEDAPMNENYSLEVIGDDGESITIFKQIAYGDLRKQNK